MAIVRKSRASLPCFLALLLGALIPLPLSAQTNSALPSNRYLLIVEASRSMQRRGQGIMDSVQDVLGSAMQGQFRPGDTLGIWTFNDEVSIGRFPLQRWSPQTAKEITLRVSNFIKTQTYEKQGNLAKLLPTLARVIQDSEFITVLLLTSGEDKMRGTPFDAPINDAFDSWRAQQQKAQMPFLTVLRGQRGKITHYAVTALPWPLEMPPLPPELQKPAIVAQTKPLPATQKPLTSAVPSLVVTGKKPEPVLTPKPPEPSPAASEPSAPATPPNEPAKTTSPPAPAAVHKPEPANPEPPMVSAKEPPSVPQVPKTDQPSAASQPPPAQVTASPAPVPAVTPQPIVPQSSPPVTPPKLPATPPAVSTSEIQPAPQPSPAPEPAVQTAVAVPQPSFFNRKSTRIVALALGVAALGCLLVLMRRSRTPSRGSFITRSLERRQKP